jgi:hypothetical protein
MEEENGVSIGEIFKVIFKRVWWVVGITAAFIIIFVLAVQFVYNPSKRTYNISYNFTYPNSTSGQYPDGTTFRLSDMTTVSTLQEIVKENGDKYSDIDISEMVTNDDITITVATDDDTGETYYSFEVKASYFKNSTQAKNFIRDVIEHPVKKINSMIAQLKYDSNLSDFAEAKTYSDKLSYLKKQRDYLLNLYDDLINLYTQYYVVDENENTLNDYRIALSKIFDEEDQTAAQNTVTQKYLVIDTERYKTNSVSEKALLERQYDYNDERLVALRAERKALLDAVNVENSSSSTSVYTTPYDEEIASLVIQQRSIKESIDKIDKALEAIDSAEYAQQISTFNAELDAYYTQLVEQASVIKSVRIAVFEEKTQVTYKTNTISLEGGLNIILAAVIGLVVGFIVAGVVICSLDMPKYLKERKEQEAAMLQAEKEKQAE